MAIPIFVESIVRKGNDELFLDVCLTRAGIMIVAEGPDGSGIREEHIISVEEMKRLLNGMEG